MKPDLIDLVAGVLNVPTHQLSMSSGPKTVPQWDSLAHVTIVAAAEGAYGVELTMPEILALTSISDIHAALQRHGVTLTGESKG